MTQKRSKSRGGWRAALLERLAGERPSRRRRRVLVLDSLEDRLAPAVVGNLYVVGTTLVYNGNSADNVIRVAGTDLAFSLTDAAGTITSSVPGLNAFGGTVSGAIPSYIQSIAINGQNGTDVLNIAGLNTSRNVIATSTVINNTGALFAKSVTETGSLVALGANISTNIAGPVAGSVTVNGTLSVTTAATITTDAVLDGDITLNGPVAGSSGLTLNAGTGGNVAAVGAINLGGIAALTVTSANNVSLHQVVDSGNTVINAQQAVNLNGSLITTGTVTINANQAGAGTSGFTQVSGDIVTTGSAVGITVGGNGSANVRGISTGSGGAVTVNAGAILDGNGSALNVNAPGASTLSLNAGVGGISLDTSVATASFTSVGDVSLRNTGQALTLNASSTANGAISVSNNLGLTVGGPVSASGVGKNITLTTTNPAAASGNISLGANSVSDPANTVTFNATGAVTATAGIVTASNVNVTAGSGTGAGGNITLNVGNIGVPVTFAGTTTTGNIAVTDAASALTVAQATTQAGTVTLTTTGANDNLVVTGNVANNDGSAITLASGQDLAVTSGQVTSATGAITLTPGTGSFTTGSLSVASGVTVATGGAITVSATKGASAVVDISGILAATGAITINGGSGAVNLLLSVSGSVYSNGAITVDNSANTTNSTIVISGTTAGTVPTAVKTSTAGDNLIVAPSTASGFNFFFTGSSVNTLQISTALGNIASSTATFSAPITFTAASGFKSWTNALTGGTVTVTPIVP